MGITYDPALLGYPQTVTELQPVMIQQPVMELEPIEVLVDENGNPVDPEHAALFESNMLVEADGVPEAEVIVDEHMEVMS